MPKRIQSWTNRYCLSRLPFKIQFAHKVEGQRTIEGTHFDLESVVLEDGTRLNLDDPGLLMLIKIINNFESREAGCLHELFFTRTPSKRYQKSEKNSLIDDFFALREVGGWAEAERMVEHFTWLTLSEFFAKFEAAVTFDHDDPGLGSDDCYMVGYDGAKCSKVFLGSSPEITFGYIYEIASTACRHFFANNVPEYNYIYFKSNDDLVFTIPFEPTVIDRDQMHYDYSRPCIYWNRVSWKQPSLDLMKLLSQFAPDEMRKHIAGAYLQDDLGV